MVSKTTLQMTILLTIIIRHPQQNCIQQYSPNRIHDITHCNHDNTHYDTFLQPTTTHQLILINFQSQYTRSEVPTGLN